MTDKTAVDWKHWGKLKSVMVFEALALLSNSEPSEEPQELEDASPEYRKRHRLLLDSFADRAQFTAGTLNMGNASLNGVSLIEVARWALANGITLPDNFPRPVRVSKAPPPITPLRGSSYIPPKKPQPIDWAHWQLMPMVKLQEAVALSVNVNPDYVTKVDNVLIKRMKIALSHVDAGSLPLEHHYPNLPMSPVSLAKFAAWAVKLNIPDLPAELVAIAATATTAPVVMPAQNTATPAPEVTETTEQRRARYLAMFETEEKREKRGALQRVASSEGVDRSNMSKDIEKARAARDQQKRAGTWISQLVQDGKHRG